MSRERYQQAKELFLQACDLDAARRKTFLDQRCGADHELRKQVDSMLSVDSQDSEFLAASPLLPTGGLQAGMILDDRYAVHELIGEGGLGEVWHAEQLRPVVRPVAIKVVKLGMDTRRVIARFEAERQTLAILDHPHIAKVLDAGSTQEGRPYFVMQLIEGASITDYAEAHGLDLEARLALFLDVCSAAQHAHQKGVIHRDIKPSNVLITEQGSCPLVKVIDFGISKAVVGLPDAASQMTGEHQIIGTPAYMSPEQASASRDVDTRTDVYALGVLLFELLTGSTPFDRQRLQDSSLIEIVRMICEEPPVRPSVRAGESESSGRSMIRADELRGDLDWIILRAIEKDRERRYASAEALADDIRRHLSHQAVRARPPSRGYQVSRFVRRNRAAVAGGLFFVIALLGGVVSTSLARIEAEEALVEADLATQFLSDLLGASDPNIAGKDVRVIDLLDSSEREIQEKFEEYPRVEVRLLRTIGIANRELGRLDASQRNLERAVSIARRIYPPDDPDLFNVINNLITLYDERWLFDLSEPLHRELIAHRQRVLGPNSRRTLGAMCNLGLFYYDQSRYVEAEQQLRQTLARMEANLAPDDGYLLSCTQGLGTALLGLERLEEARVLFTRVLERTESMQSGRSPATISALGNLAEVDFESGDTRSALAQIDIALERCRLTYPADHWRIGFKLYRRGVYLDKLGRTQEALDAYLESYPIHTRAYGPSHKASLDVIEAVVANYEALGKNDEAQTWREKLSKE